MRLKQRMEDKLAGYPELKTMISGLLDSIYIDGTNFPEYKFRGIQFDLTKGGVKITSPRFGKSFVSFSHHLYMGWEDEFITSVEVSFSKTHWRGIYAQFYWFEVVLGNGERKRIFPEDDFLERFKITYDRMIAYVIDHD